MYSYNPYYEIYLMHYGIKHKSGRYPWGSGERPYQRNNPIKKALKVLGLSIGMLALSVVASRAMLVSVGVVKTASIASTTSKVAKAATATREIVSISNPVKETLKMLGIVGVTGLALNKILE